MYVRLLSITYKNEVRRKALTIKMRNLLWTCYLILFIYSSECKDVIETDGIPKHWKQYLNDNKLRAQNRNLNAAKPDHGQQQTNLSLYKGLPLKISQISQPALNSNLNNALHFLKLNNNKNIPQEPDNKVVQTTLNPNLNNVLHLLNLNNNKKNMLQEHDNKVTLQNNVSNTESSKVKDLLNVKDEEKKKHNDDDLNKSAPKIDENPPKDKSNTSMKIVHRKENITESNLNNSSDLVSKPNKTVGLVKNKDFESTQEKELEGFVDNEELMDKLRDIGNGSTEIDWVQEEPVQEIDNSSAPQLPNLVHWMAKIEDMNRIKLNPNYPQGWIRYRFIPNQYSLSDRGNYINKVNLYTKDWYPYLRGRFRRDLNYKRVLGHVGT